MIPDCPPVHDADSRRDAAKLAGVCKASAEAFREVRRRRAVRVGPDGAVREPALGAFDVTVAPGENVQAAVDACPPGGSVLLLPGTHDGPLVLAAAKVVHVFGRGLATLRMTTGTAVTSEAAEGTMDGLIIRREAGGISNDERGCVWIRGGRLRLQACDVTSAATDVSCVWIEGGADPLLAMCKCVLHWLSYFCPNVCAGSGQLSSGLICAGVREGMRLSVDRRRGVVGAFPFLAQKNSALCFLVSSPPNHCP